MTGTREGRGPPRRARAGPGTPLTGRTSTRGTGPRRRAPAWHEGQARDGTSDGHGDTTEGPRSRQAGHRTLWPARCREGEEKKNKVPRPTALKRKPKSPPTPARTQTDGDPSPCRGPRPNPRKGVPGCSRQDSVKEVRAGPLSSSPAKPTRATRPRPAPLRSALFRSRRQHLGVLVDPLRLPPNVPGPWSAQAGDPHTMPADPTSRQ